MDAKSMSQRTVSRRLLRVFEATERARNYEDPVETDLEGELLEEDEAETPEEDPTDQRVAGRHVE